jgi:hypothetical protein
LKLLERYEIVGLRKIVRVQIPIVRRKLLMFNLQKPRKEEKESQAKVFAGNINKVPVGVSQ